MLIHDAHLPLDADRLSGPSAMREDRHERLLRYGAAVGHEDVTPVEVVFVVVVDEACAIGSVGDCFAGLRGSHVPKSLRSHFQSGKSS